MTAHKTDRHTSNGVYKFLLFLIIIIFLFIEILPIAGKIVINYMLQDKMENYTGSISALDLSLIAGEYKIKDLEILNKERFFPPFLDVAVVYINLNWSDLFDGRLKGDLAFIGPHLYLTDKKEKDSKKPSETKDKKLKFPILINRFDVKAGTLHFSNLDVKKINEVKIDNINGHLRNIDIDELQEESQLQAKGRVQNHAPISLKGEVGLGSPWQGNIDLKLENFKLPCINDTLRAYVPIDITKGITSLYGELKINQKEQIGYIKVIIKKPDVIAHKQEYIGDQHFLNEIFGGLFNWLIKNYKTDKISVEIPFEKKQGKWTSDGSEAFWSTVKSKFDQIKPKIEKRY